MVSNDLHGLYVADGLELSINEGFHDIGCGGLCCLVGAPCHRPPAMRVAAHTTGARVYCGAMTACSMRAQI